MYVVWTCVEQQQSGSRGRFAMVLLFVRRSSSTALIGEAFEPSHLELHTTPGIRAVLGHTAQGVTVTAVLTATLGQHRLDEGEDDGVDTGLDVGQ